ncbi:unnamed protein product [Boreogadus saida]
MGEQLTVASWPPVRTFDSIGQQNMHVAPVTVVNFILRWIAWAELSGHRGHRRGPPATGTHAHRLPHWEVSSAHCGSSMEELQLL